MKKHEYISEKLRDFFIAASLEASKGKGGCDHRKLNVQFRTAFQPSRAKVIITGAEDTGL